MMLMYIYMCMQGQWFSGGDYRVYLLGNPVSFYTLVHMYMFVCVCVYVCMCT